MQAMHNLTTYITYKNSCCMVYCLKLHHIIFRYRSLYIYVDSFEKFQNCIWVMGLNFFTYIFKMCFNLTTNMAICIINKPSVIKIYFTQAVRTLEFAFCTQNFQCLLRWFLPRSDLWIASSCGVERDARALLVGVLLIF